jgi:thiosulfate/3-mercaptopyruvate sulfurtransferase
MKAIGVSAVSLVDVRPAEAFKLGHLPLAVNLPALAAAPSAQGVEQLAALLGQAGVERAHEAVVVSEGGLNERSALAFLALERLGQHKVSIYLDSVERWAEQGLDVARPTANTAAAPAKPYTPALRTGLWMNDTQAAASPFPRVVVATGLQPPQRAPEGRVVHLPYTRLLNADGKPKPAPEIWKTLEQAGVPRYAELLVLADAPGEAAVGYVLFKLMGWPDVKVWAAP